MNRRRYLAAAAGVAAVAGCMGTDESDEPSNESDDDHGNGDDDYENGNGDDDYDEDESEEVDDSGELETFDDFEDLDNWNAVLGSLSADEDIYYSGSQSGLLEASESDEVVRIVYELDAPTDFSGMQPGLAATAESRVDPVIQLLDVDGYRIDFRQQVNGDHPLMHHNFGISDVDGEPDMSAIVTIQIILWSGEDSESRIWVDDLHFVPTPEDGKVMLQFDGGYESAYTDAYPLLDEHGFTATTFVTPGRIRMREDFDGNRLVDDHLEELHDAGWTIGSHTLHGTNLTNPQERDPEEEVADAKEWLEDNGYDDGAGYFSFPSGSYDEETYELVQEYHDVAFTGRYSSQGYAANPHLCSRVVDPDPEMAANVLEWTAEYGGITSLCYYELDGDSASNLESTVEYLEELESDGHLEVIGPADLEEQYLL